MSISLLNIIKWLLLIIIAITTYYALSKIFDFKKKFEQRKLIQNLVGYDKTIFDKLKSSNIYATLNLQNIEKESKKYGIPFSYRRVLVFFAIGSLIGVGITYFYLYRIFFLVPVTSIITGYIFVNISVHQYKKKFLHNIENSIQIYMSMMTTSITTFQNINAALNNIIPSVPEPIKGGLTEVYLKLQDGKNPKEAFRELNQQFAVYEFIHFNEQLCLIVETGDFRDTALRINNFKMQKKKKYRLMLLQSYKANKKIWLQFGLMTLSIPFIYLFFMNSYFKTLHESYITNVAYLIAFIYAYYSWLKLEKLELYDPTKDGSAI